MALETLERRLSDIGRRTVKLESKVNDMDTGYGEVTYRTDRRLYRIEITLDRVAHAVGVPPATEDEVDAALEEQV